jgi:hypothetical protein
MPLNAKPSSRLAKSEIWECDRSVINNKTMTKNTLKCYCSLIVISMTACSSTQPTTGGNSTTQAGGVAPAGMNAAGEVIDSSQVSEGHGRKVTGRDGWRGEILGKPAPGSPFNKLQIGMSVAEVTRIVGTPSAQGAYLTGQAFNPFSFGAGKSRYELVYKNKGRLIFDSPSAWDFGAAYSSGVASGAYGVGYLVWIINNPREPGTR